MFILGLCFHQSLQHDGGKYIIYLFFLFISEFYDRAIGLQLPQFFNCFAFSIAT